MVLASRAKASDRTALVKKLLPIIKKHYKVHLPKGGKPVLETMLYAICLEDSTVEEADASFKRLFTEFPDLNEVRVSTVGEIERAFAGQSAAEWRAFRVICVLKFVFDKVYAFEFESLRKKTLDLATKQLAKIKDLPPFVRDFTLHDVTGAHLIPIDTSLSRLLVWLGLAPPNQSPEQTGELMRAAIRKAEVEVFMFTLRCLATDPKLKAAFDATKYPIPEGGYNLEATVDRLNHLYKHGVEKPKASASKAAAKTPPAPAKKTPAKNAAPASVSPAKTNEKPRKKETAASNHDTKKVGAAKKPVKKSR
jgi:endonuclease-3